MSQQDIEDIQDVAHVRNIILNPHNRAVYTNIPHDITKALRLSRGDKMVVSLHGDSIVMKRLDLTSSNSQSEDGVV